MFVERISLWNTLSKLWTAAPAPISFETNHPQSVRLVGNELKAQGSIDQTNFLKLIEKGKNAYAAGVRELVVNLETVDRISNAGLFALYSLALIFDGKEPPSYSDGHSALAQMKHDLNIGVATPAIVFANASAGHEGQLAMLGY